MTDRSDNGIPEILDDVRKLYEAMQKFDILAARALEVNLTDLRGINILGSGPLTPTEISRRLGLTSGAVTTLIDRLQKADAAERERTEDRRSVLVVLKPAFRERAEKVYARLGGSIEAEVEKSGLFSDPAARLMTSTILAGVENALDSLEHKRDQ